MGLHGDALPEFCYRAEWNRRNSMKVKYKVFSNLYQDSVSLMQISAQISKLPGIQQASVVMGTPNNLEQLRDAGLGNEINASPNVV